MEDPKFQIYRSVGEYRYRLKSKNGEIILHGDGYPTKQSCLRGIEYVKANAPYYGRYDRRTSPGNKYYFNLKSRNREVIGVSEKYESEWEREQGIEDVRRDAPEAPVEDIG